MVENINGLVLGNFCRLAISAASPPTRQKRLSGKVLGLPVPTSAPLFQLALAQLLEKPDTAMRGDDARLLSGEVFADLLAPACVGLEIPL